MNDVDMARIYEDVNRRGITRLCHFTQSRKLLHILTLRSMMSTHVLQLQHPDLLDVTDTARRDGHLNHICCSIQYPNAWYFRTIQNRDPNFRDWVILALHPRLLWERDVLFCPRNAAAQNGGQLRPGWEGWQALFAPTVQGQGGQTRRRYPQMLASCPTDDQAEALIPEMIPQEYITAIIVPSRDAFEQEMDRLGILELIPDIEWRIAPDLFSTNYSTMVRQGRPPQEECVSPC